MSKKIVCFGEMLWDCFPDFEIAGGAPMNVALNLKQLGLEVKMISRLGNDTHGQKLRQFIQSFDLSTQLVQEDEAHMTGKVIVDNNDRENIRYEIVSPVAWDFITLTAENKKAVAEADAFVFGSLAVRHNRSWETLFQLLHIAPLKIFDINLRAPFYDFEKIEIMLGFTDILKINEDELRIVADHFGIPVENNSLAKKNDPTLPLCDFLTKKFPIQMICITLGSKGALIFQAGNTIHHPGYAVRVEDTVGAGDAFLSGFVKTFLEGKSPAEILDFSCKLGAFVATKKGGTPKYDMDDISEFAKKF